MKKVGAVANAFLDKSDEITLLKLLKLCYIAQGFSLAILDRPIFDENIEAWRYGPVIPSLYHEFKHFGKENIRRKSIDTYLEKEDGCYDVKEKNLELDNEDDKKIVQIVWNMYGKYTASDLVDMTHNRGTPWDMVYLPYQNKVIPNELIKKYYKILVNKMMGNG